MQTDGGGGHFDTPGGLSAAERVTAPSSPVAKADRGLYRKAQDRFDAPGRIGSGFLGSEDYNRRPNSGGDGKGHASAPSAGRDRGVPYTDSKGRRAYRGRSG
jgi:hypothetical protein